MNMKKTSTYQVRHAGLGSFTFDQLPPVGGKAGLTWNRLEIGRTQAAGKTIFIG
jgi:hypothetical protein